jgi:hypothetical protein
LSAAAGFPTWKAFIGRLLEWSAASSIFDDIETRRLQIALQDGEADLVADAVVRAVQRFSKATELYDFVSSIFNQKREPLPQRYALLQRLGLSAVLTTNFDTLLESTFKLDPSQALTPADTDPLLGNLSSKQFFIGKLYGSLTRPDALILTPSQYEQAIARNEAFSQFMESLFISRTILFLGCSFRGIQDYLGGLRLKGANRPHFAIMGVSGEVWQTKAEYLKDRYGIHVIPYPEGSDQEAVDSFITDLESAISQRRQQSDIPEINTPAPATQMAKKGLIREIRLENIGVFRELKLTLDPHWNLLLGINGVGKSTVLKAIALAFCGRDGRDYAERLLAADQTAGRIFIRTDQQEYVTELARTRSGVEVKSHPDRPLELEGWLALGFPALRTLTWRTSKVGAEDDGRNRPVPQDLTPLLTGELDPRLDEVKDWIVSLDYWMHKNLAALGSIQDFREGLFELLADVTGSPGLRFDKVDSQNSRVMVLTEGLSVPIEALSQGTASLLGWLGVLIRRLVQVAGGDPQAFSRPAVVLVD